MLLSSIVLTEGDEKENEREREKDELNDFNPFQVIIIKNWFKIEDKNQSWYKYKDRRHSNTAKKFYLICLRDFD